jgi:4,5-dihydroxyphthalate decarboxylase
MARGSHHLAARRGRLILPASPAGERDAIAAPTPRDTIPTADHRCLGARRSAERIWRRPRQGDPWVTFDNAHLAEYHDPANCRRAPQGKKLIDMLLDREVDAAILGGMPKDPRLKTLIPDADAAAAAWWKKYGIVPINHMFVVTRTLCQTRPEIVREVYRLLTASRAATTTPPAAGAPDMTPNGVEANRKSLEFVIDYAAQQKIIPRKFTVDELFDDTTRILGL